MKKVMMLIPALNPPDNLIAYVDELISDGFGSILLVDDGKQLLLQRNIPLGRIRHKILGVR